MTRSILLPPTNPFATRFVRPGVIPYLFPGTLDAARLVARLRNFGWRGAIVGPHGSGKSTLVESLRPELVQAGRQVIGVALHNGELSPPRQLLDSRPWNSKTLVIIDGYEQLSAWSRWRLERLCRRERCGVLVTSHGPTRLPELLRTLIDGCLVERIVEHLLADRRRLVSSDDVRRMFALHGPNVREALFALYDLHERRSRVELARL